MLNERKFEQQILEKFANLKYYCYRSQNSLQSHISQIQRGLNRFLCGH